MRSIIQGCPEVDFVQLNGPVVMSPLMATRVITNDSDYSFETRRPEDTLSTRDQRAWYDVRKINPDPRDGYAYKHVEVGLRWILPVLQTGDFDGVLAFSQGAAFAGLVTAILQNPSTHALFRNANIKPFQFALLASGYRIFRCVCINSRKELVPLNEI